MFSGLSRTYSFLRQKKTLVHIFQKIKRCILSTVSYKPILSVHLFFPFQISGIGGWLQFEFNQPKHDHGNKSITG